MDEINKEIGRKIYHQRKVINMSSTTLASLSGVSQSSISKIENGVQTATFSSILKISKVLGVSLYDLVPEEYSNSLPVEPVAPTDHLRSQLFAILNRMSESELELAFNFVLTFLKLDINSTLKGINSLVKSYESLSEKDREYLITTFNSITNK
ncbi:helix-turn-helix transcriptional regulator [Niallia taxi]|uniref:helix-turn-helix domain-containing protein n=1 Tax=Niallia taxi TaxID=2499688 RepID=UPI002E22AFC3|nr:helix-turn-helix transcriptional regulator [Niallia taxi]